MSIHFIPLELFPQIACYCDIDTCLSLVGSNKYVMKEITSPHGLKYLNNFNNFTDFPLLSFNDYIVKSNLEIMTSKCYLYHPIYKCFKYALQQKDESLIRFLQTISDNNYLDKLLSLFIRYERRNLIDWIMLKGRLNNHQFRDVFKYLNNIEILKYLISYLGNSKVKKLFNSSIIGNFSLEMIQFCYKEKLLWIDKLHFMDIKNLDVFKYVIDIVKPNNNKDIFKSNNIDDIFRQIVSGNDIDIIEYFDNKYKCADNFSKDQLIHMSINNYKTFKYMIKRLQFHFNYVENEILEELFEAVVDNGDFKSILFIYKKCCERNIVISNELWKELFENSLSDGYDIRIIEWIINNSLCNKISFVPVPSYNFYANSGNLKTSTIKWIVTNLSVNIINWNLILEKGFENRSNKDLYWILELIIHHNIPINRKILKTLSRKFEKSFIFRYHKKLLSKITEDV